MIDTIVAPATIPGTGAISLVRLSGPDCFRIADAVVQLKSGTISEAKPYTIHFGQIVIPGEAEGSLQSRLLDEVLVSVFRAPHSYTGEDSVEISAHASAYIVQEIVRLLQDAGARMAEPGEFTRRAFLNGKMDLAQAEAVADLISSSTEASHRVAMNQLKGSYSKELATLREELLQMASLLELELDFSEEEVEFASRERLKALVNATYTHVAALADSFRQGNLIKNGVPVAIIGPPNAGKSTLLNALLAEERAIVSDFPGTTRDSIEERVNWDGYLFRFIDTAGLRESDDMVEKMGIARTMELARKAEVLLLVLDATEAEDKLLETTRQVLSELVTSGHKVHILLNKSDKIDQNSTNIFVSNINKYVKLIDIKCDIIPISAKCGNGLEALKKALVDAQKNVVSNTQATFVTNERHYSALKEASQALLDVRQTLSTSLPTDLIAEDLRRAIASINSILGTDLGLDAQTVLNRIFQSHCIGK